MKLIEMPGDLFSASSECSLAHCVSSDFHMGAGIAAKFKHKFGRVSILKSLNTISGDVAFLKIENRYIYYLVTKQYFWHKPTINNLKNCLLKLKEHMIKAQVTKLAIPKIGCGLDRLIWITVKDIIISVFEDTTIIINVYTL